MPNKEVLSVLRKMVILCMVLVMFAFITVKNVYAEDFTSKKVYNIEWTGEQLTTPEDWLNSQYFDNSRYKEARFQKYYSQETDIEPGSPRETSFYITYGKEGVSIFIQANEYEKDGNGKFMASQLEIFLSPGLGNVPYYQLIVTQDTNDVEFFDWQTEGRYYQTLKGKISVISEENAAGWGTAIFIPWDCLPNDLPVDGDYWRFSIMRWAPYYLDSSTWGGNVHETGKFNLIYFQPATPEQRAEIQKYLIRKTWQRFNEKAEQLTESWYTNATTKDK